MLLEKTKDFDDDLASACLDDLEVQAHMISTLRKSNVTHFSKKLKELAENTKSTLVRQNVRKYFKKFPE